MTRCGEHDTLLLAGSLFWTSAPCVAVTWIISLVLLATPSIQ
jgi:hypothetical protein